MPPYVLLTRLTSEAIKDPRPFDELGQRVIDKLKAEFPEAKWISSYSVLGPYDHLDIFEAPDNDTATTVAVIVRSFGHETWAATPWDRFREIVRSSGRTRARK
jgi:uncharacterized protein with GYD domain